MEAWEERPTCFVSRHEQRTPEWHKLRHGTITMSKIASFIGKGYIPPSLSGKEILHYLAGLSPLPEPDAASKKRMQIGIDGEEPIRLWYAEQLRRSGDLLQGDQVKEIGLAVWKEDYRIRGSADAETKDFCAEFKVTEYLYSQLVTHFLARKKGYNPPDGDHRHIFDSHYYQLMGNGVILGKKHVDYVVYGWKEKALYTERFAVKEDEWRSEIYQPAIRLFEKEIQPLLDQAGVKRVDPSSHRGGLSRRIKLAV